MLTAAQRGLAWAVPRMRHSVSVTGTVRPLGHAPALAVELLHREVDTEARAAGAAAGAGVVARHAESEPFAQPLRQRLGQPGGDDLRRRALVVVGHAMEAQTVVLAVVQRIAGRRITVARLAGRARDGQPLAWQR